MEEKKRSPEEWAKLTGNEQKLTREEYERLLKKRENIAKIRELLTSGKNTLGSIIKNVTPIASKIEGRLQENYDSAMTPRFVGPIMGAFGYGQQNRPKPVQAAMPMPQYRYGVPFVGNSQYQFIGGPQYPRELFAFPQALVHNAANPAAFTTGQQEVVMQPRGAQMPVVQPQQQTSTADSQVVFLFDDRNNKITDIMSEYPTVAEAEAEVTRLRKQGLPAFYGSKGEYINNATKIKA